MYDESAGLSRNKMGVSPNPQRFSDMSEVQSSVLRLREPGLFGGPPGLILPGDILAG
jgi:hypothetical protein